MELTGWLSPPVMSPPPLPSSTALFPPAIFNRSDCTWPFFFAMIQKWYHWIAKDLEDLSYLDII